jgi:hypothetical protein
LREYADSSIIVSHTSCKACLRFSSRERRVTGGWWASAPSDTLCAVRKRAASFLDVLGQCVRWSLRTLGQALHASQWRGGKGVFLCLEPLALCNTRTPHTRCPRVLAVRRCGCGHAVLLTLYLPLSLNYHCVHTLRAAHLFNPLLELLEAPDMMGRREREGTHEG